MLATHPTPATIANALGSALYSLGKSLEQVHAGQFGLARAYYWDASFAVWDLA